MRRGLLLAVCISAWVCACAAREPARARPRTPLPSAPPKSQRPLDARSALVAALRALPHAGPVLGALPEPVQLRLRSRVDGLDPSERAALRAEGGRLIESLPLLSLAAGGNSPEALFALATTAAAAQELRGSLGLEATGGGRPDAARVALVRELATRAALLFLHDQAADLVTSPKRAPIACRLIERVARALGRDEIARLALALAAEVEPTSEHRLQLASAAARALDVTGARTARRAATDGQARAPDTTETDRLIERAEFVRHARGEPLDPATRLAVARALLELGRCDDARALLEPEQDEARAHLGLAASLALALTRGTACPGLPPNVGTPLLCAAAWASDADAQRAVSILQSAWVSGHGRDASAIETYAGIVHIVPLMQLAAANWAGSGSAVDLKPELSALESELAAASADFPDLRGLALFVRALSHGMAPDAAGGGELEPESAEAKELYERALALPPGADSPFAPAAQLALGGLLARQRDVQPLIDAAARGAPLPPALEPAHAGLLAWLAVTRRSRELMDRARSELATVMSRGTGQPFERASLVLTMAEADAALAPSEHTFDVLARVAGQLLQDAVPPELALRAVLDAAGAFARSGHCDRARELLRNTEGMQLPEEMRGARDALRLIGNYRAVLDASCTATAETLATALTQLGASVPEMLSPSARLWVELWKREIEARTHEQSCPKTGPCAARSVKARRVPRALLDPGVGPEASAAVLNGSLPGATLELSFRFSAERGLEPNVRFEPSFLAAELPKLELAPERPSPH